MNRNILRFLTCFLLVSMMLSMFLGCETKKNTVIEQKIQDFVVKCNTLDIDGILRCLDPDKAEPIVKAISSIEFLANIAGKEVDKEDIYSAIVSVVVSERGLDAQEFFESIEVDVLEVVINETGTAAEVYSNITYAISDINFTKAGIIYLTKNVDSWYISGVKFVKEDK